MSRLLKVMVHITLIADSLKVQVYLTVGKLLDMHLSLRLNLTSVVLQMKSKELVSLMKMQSLAVLMLGGVVSLRPVSAIGRHGEAAVDLATALPVRAFPGPRAPVMGYRDHAPLALGVAWGTRGSFTFHDYGASY